MFPGFVDIAAPSHDDLYRYFLISQAQWELANWTNPRPLMIIFLHLLGSISQEPATIWAILSLTSIFFVATLSHFFERLLAATIPSTNILLYAIVVFSLPSSWEIYQLDYGGMLSGMLCLIGLAMFTERVHAGAKADAALLIGPFLVYWAAIETKPTFSILILAISIVLAAFRRDTMSALAVVGILLISACVFIKDRLFCSPFVGDAGAGIYEVRLSPRHNFLAMATYLAAALPYSLLPGLFICYATCLINKCSQWIAWLTPLLAVAAIAPMALIPNRVLTLYSWYASVFFLLPIILVPLSIHGRRPSVTHKLGFVGIAAILAGHLWLTATSDASASYFHATSIYNRNVQDSLAVLREKSPDLNAGRILVSGLIGPSHAFRQQPYVKDRSGIAEYSFLLRTSEAAWNADAKQLGRTVQLNGLKLDEFDAFVIYGDHGRLRYILPKEQVRRLPAAWQEAVLFCGAALGYPDISSIELDRVMACFDHSAEYDAAVRLGDSPGVAERLGPLGLYHLARAQIHTGDRIRARAHLQKALSRLDNAHIRAALHSLEE